MGTPISPGGRTRGRLAGATAEGNVCSGIIVLFNGSDDVSDDDVSDDNGNDDNGNDNGNDDGIDNEIDDENGKGGGGGGGGARKAHLARSAI